ncbi:MAG: GTP-binding protein [Thermoplasmata archaeon]|nr:GTP-binding protein [Thermoplasmata archaeon]
MVEINEVKAKICLIGDWGVGKTSLIRKFVLDQFDDKYLVTFGTKVSKKRIKFKKYKDSVTDLNMVIWDIMGQDEFKVIQKNAYSGTHAALIVCDITRKDTLKTIKKWRDDIFSVTKEIPVVVLANKSDLQDQRKFKIDDLTKVASEINAKYFFTSAKTGQNVESAFRAIGKKLI